MVDVRMREEDRVRAADAVAQRVPETLRPHLLTAQSKILQSIPMALLSFHQAVEVYNEALSLAPTRWLARSLRLRPAPSVTLLGRTGRTAS